MQSDAIPLAILDDSPEAMRPDLVFWLQHLATVGFDRGNSLIQPSLSVEIHEDPAR